MSPPKSAHFVHDKRALMDGIRIQHNNGDINGETRVKTRTCCKPFLHFAAWFDRDLHFELIWVKLRS